MTGQELLTVLTGLSGVTNRVVEGIKPFFNRFNLSEETYSAAVYLISIAIGIVFTWAGGPALNIFALTEGFSGLNMTAGRIFTGILVGGGSNFLHLIFEAFEFLRRPAQSSVAVSTPANVSTNVSVQSEPATTAAVSWGVDTAQSSDYTVNKYK